MNKSNCKTQRGLVVLLLTTFALAGCANVGGGIGISIPVGPFGSLGVNLGSDGRVGGSVGVGYGPASVQIGTSTRLPTATPEETKK
jgi:hypothetical protein